MSDSLHTPKAQIRTAMRGLLARMTDDERRTASAAACARLAALEPFSHAAIVMMYLPLPREVDVTPAVLRCFRRGQTVCVPKVDWNRKEMEPVEITSLDDAMLDIDEHGVRSPREGRPIQPGLIDVVIVPGLAYDPHGHRLGRGQGYYDRFLARMRPNATSIGLAFDLQMTDSVPTDRLDRAVDIVVTDRRVTWASGKTSGNGARRG
jgi:5-formyltetrahydrofolate cyclo-ligase